MPINVVMMVVMVVAIGLGGKPFLDVRDFPVGVIKPTSEQLFSDRLALGGVEDRCRRIERAKPGNNSLPLCVIHNVSFGEHDAVGNGGLLHRLEMRVERRLTSGSIRDGYDAVQTIT